MEGRLGGNSDSLLRSIVISWVDIMVKGGEKSIVVNGYGNFVYEKEIYDIRL